MIDSIAQTIADFLKENGSSTESTKTLIKLLIQLAIAICLFFANKLLLKFRLTRKLISIDKEKYAGYYLQIIGRNNERKYSILYIRYFNDSATLSLTTGRYRLKGFQYDSSGARLIDFESDNVILKKGPSEYIEFSWTAIGLKGRKLFNGYTLMSPDDPENIELLEGNGFYITFDQLPDHYDMRFIKLTRKRLTELQSILNSKSEELLKYKFKNEKDRIDFIRKLNGIPKDKLEYIPYPETK